MDSASLFNNENLLSFARVTLPDLAAAILLGEELLFVGEKCIFKNADIFAERPPITEPAPLLILSYL